VNSWLSILHFIRAEWDRAEDNRGNSDLISSVTPRALVLRIRTTARYATPTNSHKVEISGASLAVHKCVRQTHRAEFVADGIGDASPSIVECTARAASRCYWLMCNRESPTMSSRVTG
jgi:hypothetical protein